MVSFNEGDLLGFATNAHIQTAKSLQAITLLTDHCSLLIDSCSTRFFSRFALFNASTAWGYLLLYYSRWFIGSLMYARTYFMHYNVNLITEISAGLFCWGHFPCSMDKEIKCEFCNIFDIILKHHQRNVRGRN